MLPFLIGGVFIAGLMVFENLRALSEPWNSREERREFEQLREHWKNDGWMLYR